MRVETGIVKNMTTVVSSTINDTRKYVYLDENVLSCCENLRLTVSVFTVDYFICKLK